jgi:hypothetical protein
VLCRQDNEKGASLIVNLVGGCGVATLTTICWPPQAFEIPRMRNTAAGWPIIGWRLRHGVLLRCAFTDIADDLPGSVELDVTELVDTDW